MEKVKVTQHALVQRISRALAKNGLKLRRARGSKRNQFGDWYLADSERVIHSNIKIDDLSSFSFECSGQRFGPFLKGFEELVA